MVQSRVFRALLFLSIFALAIPLFAQQTGAIHGKVEASDGSLLPGVTVEASSNVLPQPRVTTTDSAGEYRLPALIPGNYTITFTLSGMSVVTRKTTVILGQDLAIDAKLGVAAVSENITVTAEQTLVNKESTALQEGLSQQQIQQLPVAQNYGDLQKLIPGVMYSQDTFRGPSAGSNGQDNVYLFDGANVTMPLYGILTAEPATHDIASVNIIKGGAKAVDFFRAGGFQIDSVSKSGTNKISGEVQYQFLRPNMVAGSRSGTQALQFRQDNSWTTANVGGPIIPDRVFFYGSFYRPNAKLGNQSNVYGALPDYNDTRNEEFGKVTITPTQSWLINGTYRNSHHTQSGSFGATGSPTTGSSSTSNLKIGTFEGSDIINNHSYATFKFTDFRNPGFGGSDFGTGITPSLTVGTQLDINNLDKMGLLTVPTVISTNPGQTAFVTPYINKYGYPKNGVATGGGTVGYGTFTQNDDSFYRKSGQVGYNMTIGSAVTHDLHIAYLRHNDAEDLFRVSNGWGSISIPGGSVNCTAAICGTAQPIYFQAVFNAQSINVPGVPSKLHSEFKSQSFEINDTINMRNWSFNIGILDSNDSLYGQGLKPADNLAGWVSSPGTKYKMYEFPFKDMIQPRLGTTWAYNGTDTVYASFARYNPEANSDARAASWDRNFITRTVTANFDQNGKLIGVAPVAGSSGKLWVPGTKPTQNKEWMIGTSRQLTSRWSGRFYTRYKKGDHFMEDTNNTARVVLNAPPGVPNTPYIPDLSDRLKAIGSGSTYVIANLDGAFTKYYEATAETQYNGAKFFVNSSLTWSHYYGNFDQDNSTTSLSNDGAIFIGSSNIGDGAGHQVWNNMYGNLRGDRPINFKINGAYTLPWKSTVGAFFVYQSGQPYALWSNLVYVGLPLPDGTNDTAKYAEPAGSRRSPAIHQLDLNYTQNFPVWRGINFQLLIDMFNVTNTQTGYNYENRMSILGACNTSNCISTGVAALPSVNAPFPNSYLNPRRYQVAARVQF